MDRVNHQQPGLSATPVALAVGELPGPPFIESLVNSLAGQFRIFVFGRSDQVPQYQYSVQVERVPKKRWNKIFYALGGVIRVLVFRPRMLPALLREAKADGPRGSINRVVFCFPYLLHQPKLVHVQWAKTVGAIASLRSYYSFAILLSLRGTHISSSPLGNPALAATYRKVFPSIDGFHAVCRSIALETEALGAPAERIRVIYSGVEEHLLKRTPKLLRSELRPIKILSVGRIHWRKGYHRAITALSLLPTHNKVEYRIVGGPPNQELLYLGNRLPSTVHIDYVGLLTKERVLEEMCGEADFLLVPSVGEGIANVAIEAMAIGLPVLATNCGGMPELITHQGTGILCDPWSAKAMMEAIQLFAGLPLEARLRMRDAARKMVLSEWRLSSTVQGMSELYSNLIVTGDKREFAA
jgi:glycosyltransferase involved in cell wall biosynthesis